MNAAIWGILLGIPAGWVVNLLADTIPARRSLRTTWFWSFQQLGIMGGNVAPVLKDEDDNFALPAPRRYLLVWLVSMALGGLAFAQLGGTFNTLLVALEAWFFLAIAVIDLENRLVLNRMLLAATPLILVANLLFGEATITSILLGAVTGFGFFLLLAILVPGGMGMGDVKLAGMIGLTTGLSSVMTALFIAILVGGVAGAVILLNNRFHQRALRGQTMAYAPYLVVGVWVVLLDGLQLLHNYLERL
jgi:prepilin signal peptidase PulO-like enzyme (type II secretory pathway)